MRKDEKNIGLNNPIDENMSFNNLQNNDNDSSQNFNVQIFHNEIPIGKNS